MADVVLKSRIIAPDGMIYVYCMRLDMGRRTAKETHSIAGDHHDLESQPLNAEYRDFVSWLKGMEFHNKRIESATYDIQRWLEKNTKNVEWMDRFVAAVESGNLDALQFDLGLELEIALGEKDLIFSYDVAEYVEPPAPELPGLKEDLSGLLPMAFAVAPFSGVPITRLNIGDRVRVRFADPKEGRAANYIRRLGVKEERGRFEINAQLKSLSTVPKTKEILAKLRLEGGAEAYVLEENHDLRVRLPDAKKGNSSYDRARRESAAVGGQLAAILIVVAFLSIAGLLYFLMS